MTPLQAFKDQLIRPDLTAHLAASLIGEGAMIPTPNGSKPLLYADYVASGRALRIVEDFMLDQVLPFYANTHTESSYCGARTTALREAARAEIARVMGAGPGAHVIFSGPGATSGLNRIVGLLDLAGLVAQGKRAVVLHGPYEHHSNLLPWRETGALVVEIPEAEDGGPCLTALTAALQDHRGADLLVGSFSAMSNVTGITTDTDQVTAILKSHGALAIWDYAGGGPYLPMQMGAGATAKDAIVFSPHKFIGGPGASGVMCFLASMIRRQTPTQPGGGTVVYVSSDIQVYSPDPVAREEAGTPGILGDIRAGLVVLVKEALGQDWMSARNAALRALALAVWEKNPAITVLGNPGAPCGLPIFSLVIRGAGGQPVNPHAFTTALSNHTGIQARGGCSCAGPYGHRLLEVGVEETNAILARIRAGQQVEKPGWVRLNLSCLLTDKKADQIIQGLSWAATHSDRLIAPQLSLQPGAALFV
jgi:selenocysteine lyase/cysteine desulfurase